MFQKSGLAKRMVELQMQIPQPGSENLENIPFSILLPLRLTKNGKWAQLIPLIHSTFPFLLGPDSLASWVEYEVEYEALGLKMDGSREKKQMMHRDLRAKD